MLDIELNETNSYKLFSTSVAANQLKLHLSLNNRFRNKVGSDNKYNETKVFQPQIRTKFILISSEI